MYLVAYVDGRLHAETRAGSSSPDMTTKGRKGRRRDPA